MNRIVVYKTGNGCHPAFLCAKLKVYFNRHQHRIRQNQGKF